MVSTKPNYDASTAGLEHRHQLALAVAHQCEQVLRSQFLAQQVILFGSVVGDGPWHWDSDVDIAVRGLSHRDWLEASDVLMELAPSWLKIDLVRLESVRGEVCDRILRPI